MQKRFVLLAFLLLSGNLLFSQTHYMTVRVSISFKNKVTRYQMVPDIGTSTNHPLKGKIQQLEEGLIKVTENSNNSMVLSSEVDMLTYFDSHGWDLVSVNEVMIIEDKLIQYLFKSE